MIFDAIINGIREPPKYDPMKFPCWLFANILVISVISECNAEEFERSTEEQNYFHQRVYKKIDDNYGGYITKNNLEKI